MAFIDILIAALEGLKKYVPYMSHDMTKPVFGSFQQGQTQIGLRSHRS